MRWVTDWAYMNITLVTCELMMARTWVTGQVTDESHMGRGLHYR